MTVLKPSWPRQQLSVWQCGVAPGFFGLTALPHCRFDFTMLWLLCGQSCTQFFFGSSPLRRPPHLENMGVGLLPFASSSAPRRLPPRACAMCRAAAPRAVVPHLHRQRSLPRATPDSERSTSGEDGADESGAGSASTSELAEESAGVRYAVLAPRGRLVLPVLCGPPAFWSLRQQLSPTDWHPQGRAGGAALLQARDFAPPAARLPVPAHVLGVRDGVVQAPRRV